MASRWSVVFAAAAAALALPAYAAPAKPLIVLFTPGVSTDPTAGPQQAQDNAVHMHNVAVALRQQFEESGIVDAVIYDPDSALFVRATMEGHLHLGNVALPSADERFAMAKASGASYIGTLTDGSDANQKANTVDVELQTEEIDSHKTWKSHQNATGGGAASINGGSGASKNALLSVASILVNQFLAGPLHELAVATPREVPPPEPVASVVVPPPPVTPVAGPTMTVATPGKLPVAAAPDAAPHTGAHEASAFVSTGTDSDTEASAESHQGDTQVRSGDFEAAILSFRKAISLAPRNPKYRSQLVNAYLAANRTTDALSEAKRTLAVLPEEDRTDRLAAMRLLGEVLTKNGDTTAARTTYEGIINAQPNATWAKIALADLLQTQGETDESEGLYKQVIAVAPTDRDALLGYARLLATKGDYQSALTQLTAASDANDPAARYRTAIELFDDGVDRIADLVEQNRTAWEEKRIAQDVFYKATSAQSAKVSGLVSLLKAVPPPAGSEERVKQRHSKRVLAASLLLQGVASLLSQVETGDADEGEKSKLYLGEFRREIKDVGDTAAAPAPAEP